MAFIRQPAPIWFRIVAILLVLWGAMGCWSCYQHIVMGPEAMGADVTDYDRALYAALPVWYNAVFAVAVGTGFLGAIALLLRSVLSRPLFVISVVGIVVMFGWMFAMTDLIAVKGVATATGFPIVILAIGVFQLWLSGLARRRGWIG